MGRGGSRQVAFARSGDIVPALGSLERAEPGPGGMGYASAVQAEKTGEETSIAGELNIFI